MANKRMLSLVFLFIGVSMLYTISSSRNNISQSPMTNHTAVSTLSPSPLPSSNTPARSQYPIHKHIYATMFWVGEKATSANDYIPNMTSAWDNNWLEHYGGIDNPYSRQDYYPKAFKPKENPFYIALPYDDFSDTGRKQNAALISWYDPSIPESHSLVKNRWVKLIYKDATCYAQWEDVGPFETDDFEYVFNGKKPKSQRAAIDLSPAVRHCLKMALNDYIDWQFIDEKDVPEGPWKETVTISQTNW